MCEYCENDRSIKGKKVHCFIDGFDTKEDETFPLLAMYINYNGKLYFDHEDCEGNGSYGWIKTKKHSFNYCPMCGRKLK